MDKDWLFETEEYICDLRTVGVLIRDNKILVQRDRVGNEFALPGGHVKIGETLENGLIREYKEETGSDIFCRRLLWSEECFWEWNGKQAHNIAFYYLSNCVRV
jgi:ADP-ribose pyrophosphatase YjhB (NUDIX family)